MPPQGNRTIEISMRARMDASQARAELGRLERDMERATRPRRRAVETEEEYRRRADAYLERLRRSVDRPSRREGIPIDQAWEIVREEERRRRERDIRLARQREAAEIRLYRAQTRLVRAAQYGLLPVLNALTAGMSDMTREGERAMRQLSQLNMAMAAMQMGGATMAVPTGAGVGGPAGAGLGRLGGTLGRLATSLAAIGTIGVILVAAAQTVAQAVDALTRKIEEEAERRAKQTAVESLREEAARIREYLKNPVYNPFIPGVNTPEYFESLRRRAEELEARAERMERAERIQERGRAARARAEALRRAHMTPEEAAQETAQELREAAAELRAAAQDLLTIEKGSATALRMQEQANDLERRANALLEDIEKNPKSWSETALEIIGGGSRLARPLSLSELQGRQRVVQVNFSGISDEIAAALAARFGPMIYDILRQLGYLPA